MRKIKFVNGEYYHIFNRGVDKRDVFLDYEDLARFFQSMEEFNTVNPIGSIYENSFYEDDELGCPTPKLEERLVSFICYCLNPNHYHFILEQVTDNGISEFMKRIGGYTLYFNNKNKRNGSLFQGRFKAVHIDSNEQLLHVSAYVNLNNKVHQFGGPTAKLNKSSWDEYVSEGNIKNNIKYKDFCEKGIILNQFNSREEYKKFAEDSLIDIKDRKEIEKLFLEQE